MLATGARPYLPTRPRPPSSVVQAWDAIRSPQDVAGPVLVADWGGGWDGLDAAERLAGAGLQVTLACAALVPGETLHQYQRNLYLGRLDELRDHDPAPPRAGPRRRRARAAPCVLRRPRPCPDVATLVLAQGRAPADDLWAALESHPGAIRVGDVLGPRTLEEAVLEGTRAILSRADGAAADRLMAKRIGGHLVAESLAALGAEAAFGVPGIHALPIWEGLRRAPISVYGTAPSWPPGSRPMGTRAPAVARLPCFSPPAPARSTPSPR